MFDVIYRAFKSHKFQIDLNDISVDLQYKNEIEDFSSLQVYETLANEGSISKIFKKVYGDSEKYFYIFVNFLKNSIRFTD